MAWGYNSSGQLGDGTRENHYTPVQIIEGKKIVKIAAGYSHALAIDDEGNLWAWGNNATGQIGDGTKESRFLPVQIMQGKYFTDIAAGSSCSYAIDVRGQLWGWGYNKSSLLGDGTKENRLYPIRIEGDTKFSQVSTDNVMSNHTLAMDADGECWAWGSNTDGQIGDGATRNYLEPIHVMQDKRFVKVSARSYKTLAIDTEGNLWVWGMHSYEEYSYQTVQVMPDKKFKEISAGDDHCLVIDTEGNLWAWGNNTYGQLGNGTTQKSNTPIQVMKGTKFVQVSAGGYVSHAIDEEGNLWGWGRELCVGNNSGTSETQPVQIKKGTKFKQVVASGVMCFAIDVEGNLWGWGRNTYGDLGDGTSNNRKAPVQLTEGTKFTFISTNVTEPNGKASDNGTIAIDEEGNLWGWGINGAGISVYEEIIVGGSIKKIVVGYLPELMCEDEKFSMAAIGQVNYQHKLVLDANGTLWMWGNNAYGQLGNGTQDADVNKDNFDHKEELMSGRRFVYIAAGAESSYAIDEYGNLWAWGRNDYGHLNGVTSKQHTPKQIALGE